MTHNNIASSTRSATSKLDQDMEEQQQTPEPSPEPALRVILTSPLSQKKKSEEGTEKPRTDDPHLDASMSQLNTPPTLGMEKKMDDLKSTMETQRPRKQTRS
jgi:hypothetical protein